VLLIGTACAEDHNSESSPNGSFGISTNYSPIPFDFGGLDFTPSSVFVNVEGFAYDLSEFDGLAPDRRDELVHRIGRYFSDEQGEQWRPLSEDLASGLISMNSEGDRGLLAVEHRMVPTMNGDACQDGCTLRFQISPEISFLDTSETEDSWEAKPDVWVYAEMQYRTSARIEMNGLKSMNEDTLEGTFTLGTIFLRGDERGVMPSLEPLEFRVYDARRFDAPRDEMGEAPVGIEDEGEARQ
jgi:hypothetical protein